MDQKKAKAIADEILSMIERHGHIEYGEQVTQKAHMYQSAKLAEKEGYDQETILASFLHDIGHICVLDQDTEFERLGEYGVMRHDRIGGDYLRDRGFSEKVAALVEGHVAAKRYLTFTDPKYYERLSEASKKTLEYQGGEMTEEEAREFDKSELFGMSLKMRTWDDEAKEPDTKTGNMEYLRQMIVEYLTGRDR